MIDELGDRMKRYESVAKSYLLPRSYTILRVDGRAFHTYCRNLQRPIDPGYVEDFDAMAVYLCENVANCKLGYAQSDELTLLLCDFENLGTQQFFDGNIQKITSVVASMATASFNKVRYKRKLGAPDCFGGAEDDEYSYSYDPGHLQDVLEQPLATFDCRAFTVPTRIEAMNSFIWRNQDCMRNAISMFAQSIFSSKELNGKSSPEKIQMMYEKTGITWEDRDEKSRFGRYFIKNTFEETITLPAKKLVAKHNILLNTEFSEFAYVQEAGNVERTRWVSAPAWKFTDDKDRLLALIPAQP